MSFFFVLLDGEGRAIASRDTQEAAIASATRIARSRRGEPVAVWLTDYRPKRGAVVASVLRLVRSVRYRHESRDA